LNRKSSSNAPGVTYEEGRRMPRGRKQPEGAQMDRHHEQYVKLGLTIAYFRKLKGLTQEDLAKQVGCSRTHISNVEAPKIQTSISLELLLNIADALEMPLSRLFEMR
jgi:DNA-binding XRE family transcriptional regulator